MKLTKQADINHQCAFTLIELIIVIVIVIVILGILTAFAIPKFADLSSAAKKSTLNNIAGVIKSNIAIVRSVALSKGLTISASNPSDQSIYLIETHAGTFEIDWRNLCPESRAEMGDALTLDEHIGLKATDGLSIITDNQYFRVGYDIQGNGAATANGCYVTYNSFGYPECTVDIVDIDC